MSWWKAFVRAAAEKALAWLGEQVAPKVPQPPRRKPRRSSRPVH
jgi:hypothetical protein